MKLAVSDGHKRTRYINRQGGKFPAKRRQLSSSKYQLPVDLNDAVEAVSLLNRDNRGVEQQCYPPTISGQIALVANAELHWSECRNDVEFLIPGRGALASDRNVLVGNYREHTAPKELGSVVPHVSDDHAVQAY